MRVDQYLWSVRLFKSRNLASTACRKGQVTDNGQIVKHKCEIFKTTGYHRQKQLGKHRQTHVTIVKHKCQNRQT